MTSGRADQGTAQEIADRIGQSVEGVKALEKTGLLLSEGGELKTADVVETSRERARIEHSPVLLDYVAAQGLRIQKHEHILEMLMRAIGLHALAFEMTDEQLVDLYGAARAREKCRPSLEAADRMVDVLLALDDRAMKRMDELTGEQRGWRHVGLWAEDLVDFLSSRADLAQDHRAQLLRNDLLRALAHWKYHAHILIGLTYPDEDPHKLLNELTQRASKAYAPPRGRRRDSRDVIESLTILLDTVHRKVSKLRPA